MSRQLHFGDWSFDADADVVNNGRATIRLEPQVARLLDYLLQHQNELLSRERLLRDVWDGRIVSDDAIHRCIGILRQTLSPDDRRAFIRTIPKKGYIASFPPSPERSSERAGTPKLRTARKTRIWTTGVAVLAVPIVPLALNVGGLRDRLLIDTFSEVALRPIHVDATSIAVLPFADLSPEQDQSYFAEGISEEILNLLSRLPELRVIARTSSFSFKDRDNDIPTIAGALNVSHVLEGSVRKSGSRVRISVQLIDAGTSTRLWSDSYDRDLGDILTVQSEIARAVASALEVNLGLATAHQPADQSVDPEAFDLYLRGLQQVEIWTWSSLVDAEKSFEESIERDPGFVRAYYGLGLALLNQIIHEVQPLRENLPKLRDVVARGLERMPDSAGLIALEGLVARYDGDIELAERYLEQAIALEPSDVWVRNLYCIFRQDQGRPTEALRTQQRTLEIDPLNPAVYVPIGFSHLDLWNTEEALAAAQRFKQLNSPGNLTALGMNAIIKVVLRGDFAGAIRDVLPEAGSHQSPENTWAAVDIAASYFTIEDMTNGRAWLEKARRSAAESEDWAIRLLEAYATVIEGDARPFRTMRTEWLISSYDFRRLFDLDMYLLADELIRRDEAGRAVELMLTIAPEWAEYKNQPDLAAEDFYPASALVKSGYSSYPAMHFVPFIRALRAAGDRPGADNMLRHLETILGSRRERGLFIEEIHVAEARALRDDREGALDALERAERDRTIYHNWQLRLLHGDIFEEIRDHPRFLAVIDRIRNEMSRQRAELAASLSSEDLAD